MNHHLNLENVLPFSRAHPLLSTFPTGGVRPHTLRTIILALKKKPSEKRVDLLTKRLLKPTLITSISNMAAVDAASTSQRYEVCMRGDRTAWAAGNLLLGARLPLDQGVWAAATVSCGWLQKWWASVCHSSLLLQQGAAGIPDYLIACKSSLKLPIHHKVVWRVSVWEWETETERERCQELWWAISDVKRLWIVIV